MKNKEAIKHVYDEIHAPDALFGKVMEMDKKKTKVRNVVKYAMGTVAAFALAFVTSNGICYAATGETWISKAIVYINGEATEQEIEWHQEGDLLYSEIQVPVEEGDEAKVEVFSFVTDNEQPVDQVIITSDSNNISSEAGMIEKNTDAVVSEDMFSAELLQEDGKIYLVAEEEKIDITQDFSDGEATGTFSYCGLTMRYTVTGTVEECEISMMCE